MLPSFVPALCLLASALAMLCLSILWSRAWLFNLCLKVSMFATAIWAFIVSVTGGTNSATLYVLLMVGHFFGVIFLNRMWLRVLYSIVWLLTLFGLLVLKGAVHF